MKKAIILLLALTIVLALCACGKSATSNPVSTEPAPTAPVPTDPVPTDAEEGAILCCQYIKDHLKNSDSLQIKSISAVQATERGGCWEYRIEFSAMNGFGGYSVETWYMQATEKRVMEDALSGANGFFKQYNEDLKENGYPTPEINIEIVEAGLK